jgi:dTMP kinase
VTGAPARPGEGEGVARGRLVTFEGGEGAGKSTQCARLARRLGREGLAVIVTREPGGAPGAEAIRALLVDGAIERWDATAEALLHFAARREHLTRTLWPALDGGKWVLSDRFADSTMAYQGCAMGVGREAVETLYRLAVGDFEPDLTLILDLPVDVGLARAAARGGPQHRYERMGRAFHERLREAFLDIARGAPQRCAVIDAAQPEDAVAARAFELVRERLGVEMLDGG